VANYAQTKLLEERISMVIAAVTWQPEQNEANAKAAAAGGHKVLQLTCNGVVSGGPGLAAAGPRRPGPRPSALPFDRHRCPPLRL
jgi:hypothetical protein